MLGLGKARRLLKYQGTLWMPLDVIPAKRWRGRTIPRPLFALLQVQLAKGGHL